MNSLVDGVTTEALRDRKRVPDGIGSISESTLGTSVLTLGITDCRVLLEIVPACPNEMRVIILPTAHRRPTVGDGTYCRHSGGSSFCRDGSGVCGYGEEQKERSKSGSVHLEEDVRV